MNHLIVNLRQSIYPARMSVVVFDDYKLAHKAVFKRDDTNDHKAVFIADPPKFWVFLYWNLPTDAVAHECCHMTVDVMEWLGFQVGKNHEPAAYLHGWIFGRAHRAMLKFGEMTGRLGAF